MFDTLVTKLFEIVELFFCARICHQWERGVVLRFGKFHRMAKPGMVWHWPLNIESVALEDIYSKPARLGAQSLTTADAQSVVLSPTIVYRVRNVKKVILKAGGHEEAILAIVPGTVAELVVGSKWSDLNTEEFRQTVLALCRDRAYDWGIEVESLQFSDLVATGTYRLMNENSHN